MSWLLHYYHVAPPLGNPPNPLGNPSIPGTWWHSSPAKSQGIMLSPHLVPSNHTDSLSLLPSPPSLSFPLSLAQIYGPLESQQTSSPSSIAPPTVARRYSATSIIRQTGTRQERYDSRDLIWSRLVINVCTYARTKVKCSEKQSAWTIEVRIIEVSLYYVVHYRNWKDADNTRHT